MAIFGAANGKSQLLGGAAKMAKWSSLDIAMRNQGLALNVNIDGIGTSSIMPNIGKIQLASGTLPDDYLSFLPAGAYAAFSIAPVGVFNFRLTGKENTPQNRDLYKIFSGLPQWDSIRRTETGKVERMFSSVLITHQTTCFRLPTTFFVRSC